MRLILLILGVTLCLGQTIPDGFTLVPIAEGNADSTLQAALTFGKNKLLTMLYTNKYIPDTNFEITLVNSYAKQVKTSSTSYAFDIQLSNFKDIVIYTTFVVYRSSTGVFTLSSYSINIKKTTQVNPVFTDVPLTEVSSSPIILTLRDFGFAAVTQQVQQKYPSIVNTFKLTKTTSVQKEILADGRVLYKFKAEGDNGKNAKLVAAYIVSYNPTTKETVLLASSYIVADGDQTLLLEGLQTGAPGYALISSADVEASDLVKSIRDFGASELVKVGIQKGKVPNNGHPYGISTTNGVYQQALSDVTNYKFDLVLTDNQGSSISAIYIVAYNPQTQAKNLTTYIYNVQCSN